MTPKELHDAVTPFLDPRTFEPFILVTTKGAVIHIDHPSELEQGIRFRLKRRREESKGEFVDPNEVASVERLDRHNGGAGLRYSRFRSTLGSLLNAQPFVPFAVELKSLKKLRIDHPERLAMSGRFALVVGSGQPFVTFSDADVVHIAAEEVTTNAG